MIFIKINIYCKLLLLFNFLQIFTEQYSNYLDYVRLATSPENPRPNIFISEIKKALDKSIDLDNLALVELLVNQLYSFPVDSLSISSFQDKQDVLTELINEEAQLLETLPVKNDLDGNYGRATEFLGDDLLPGSPASDLVEELDEYTFSKKDYAELINKIKEINLLAYQQIIECHKFEGSNCIYKAHNIAPGVYTYFSLKGYPYMMLSLDFKSKSESEQAVELSLASKEYNYLFENRGSQITPIEISSVLNHIKVLAPSLYDFLIRVDSDGSGHIRRWYGSTYNLKISCSKKDGLPVIEIGSLFLNYDSSIQNFAIAHELGHYLLEHFTSQFKVVRRYGEEESFFLENAYRRILESEADRAAVIDFQADIKAGIAWFEANNYLDQSKTFDRTHPLNEFRVKHLLELEREVSLTSRKPKKTIDWEALASDYLASGRCQS